MTVRTGWVAAILWLLSTSAQAQPAAEVEGSLDLAVVRRVLDRHARDALRGCWREARARTGARTGWGRVRFAIDASGNVTAIEVSSSLDGPFAGCVTAALRPLRFPSQSGGLMVVLPLQLAEPERRRGPPRVSTDPRRPFRILP